MDSVINKYPNKFVGCCLANPAEDGSGIQLLEHLVTKVFGYFSYQTTSTPVLTQRNDFDVFSFPYRMDTPLFALIHTYGHQVKRFHPDCSDLLPTSYLDMFNDICR